MKPSSFQNAIRLQFDCLAKRVIDTVGGSWKSRCHDLYIRIMIRPYDTVRPSEWEW